MFEIKQSMFEIKQSIFELNSTYQNGKEVMALFMSNSFIAAATSAWIMSLDLREAAAATAAAAPAPEAAACCKIFWMLNFKKELTSRCLSWPETAAPEVGGDGVEVVFA